MIALRNSLRIQAPTNDEQQLLLKRPIRESKIEQNVEDNGVNKGMNTTMLKTTDRIYRSKE